MQDCTMANGQYGSLACAETQINHIGLDSNAIALCMDDDDADDVHPLLQV